MAVIGAEWNCLGSKLIFSNEYFENSGHINIPIKVVCFEEISIFVFPDIAEVCKMNPMLHCLCDFGQVIFLTCIQRSGKKTNAVEGFVHTLYYAQIIFLIGSYASLSQYRIRRVIRVQCHLYI